MTGLENGFAYDDVFLVAENPSVESLRAPWEYFRESYWGPARGHTALYRPGVVLAWSLQHQVAGGAAWPFHLANVLLYATTCVTVLALLRQFVAPGAAAVGAALFAAHPVHVEAVANVVGQSELWVAIFLLAALALYARDRTAGALTTPSAIGMAVAFAAALCFKEHAIVLPALVIALEWAGRRGSFAVVPNAWRHARVMALALGALAAAYLYGRAQVLGDVRGDDPVWALVGASAAERARVMLGLVPEIARLFFWPARLYADYSPQHTPVLKDWAWEHLPGAVLFLAVVAASVAAWRRGIAVPALAVAWFAVTFAPTSNLLFPVGVLLAERTLFLPSVAVALVAAWLVERAAAWPLPARGTVVAAVLALVALGTLHSAQRSPVWEDNPTLFSTLAVEAPTNFRAQMALADFNVRGGRFAAADSLFRRGLALAPDHVPARLTYVLELQYQGRFAEALPLALSAYRDQPSSSPAMLSSVLCLLAAQRFHEARRVTLDGLAAGFGTPLLRQLRQTTDSMLAVTDSADVRNRFVREGRVFVRGGGPLSVTIRRETFEEVRRAEAMQFASRSASHSAGSGEGVAP